MRTLLILTLLAVLAAGCTQPGTTDNGAAPPVGGNSTGTGGAAFKDAVKDSHDFAADAASGLPVGTPATKAFTIDPGYTKITLNVTWSGDAPGAGAGAAQGIVVKVGSLSCTLDGPVTGPSTCTKVGTAVPGPAKIEYSGAGPVTADVKVTES